MESVLEGRGRAPIARAGNRFTVMLPEKIQIVTQSNLFTTMLKLYLFTVGKELSACVKNFLAKVLILGEAHQKS